jgi:hypothetical protein
MSRTSIQEAQLNDRMEAEKCPLDKPHGDVVCREGVLWGLTYSEMGPPDSRSAIGDCSCCRVRALR